MLPDVLECSHGTSRAASFLLATLSFRLIIEPTAALVPDPLARLLIQYWHAVLGVNTWQRAHCAVLNRTPCRRPDCSTTVNLRMFLEPTGSRAAPKEPRAGRSDGAKVTQRARTLPGSIWHLQSPAPTYFCMRLCNKLLRRGYTVKGKAGCGRVRYDGDSRTLLIHTASTGGRCTQQRASLPYRTTAASSKPSYSEAGRSHQRSGSQK